MGQLFAGAMVPGLLLALMYAGYIVAVAYAKPHLAPAATLAERALHTRAQVLRMLLVEAVPPLILILGVLGSLLGGIATATEASAIGAALAFVIMVLKGRFVWATFYLSIIETGKATAMVLFVIDRKFVETVQAIAGDEINIQFHDGGTLVPTFEIFDAVGQGDIQAAGDWPGYWAGRSASFSPIASHVSLFNALDSILWVQEWGGAELYNEVYGQHNMIYLVYGVTNNESGFRTNTQLVSLDDLDGMRLRLSGREQGQVLERIGGEQVLLAGQEIYTALERGVIDGAEYSVPGVDYEAGFHEVTNFWSVPGWHQSQSVFGVMINRNAWDDLGEGLQDKLRIAAERTLLWSLAWSERRSNEGTKAFQEAGVEINRWSEEALERAQEMALEVIVQSSCEDPMVAKIYHSQISYLEDYALWRGMSEPFNLGRNPPTPDLAAIEECM